MRSPSRKNAKIAENTGSSVKMRLRRLQKYGEHQHHHADDGKVAHAERQRVDLFIRHGLFRDHQVDGVKHRCEQADDIAERGLERLVQRHQR